MNPTAAIGETRVKRIIIHGLKPKFRGFDIVIQGRPTQPLLVEFENILAGKEATAKQTAGLSVKNEEETLYTNRSRNIKHQDVIYSKKKSFK